MTKPFIEDYPYPSLGPAISRVVVRTRKNQPDGDRLWRYSRKASLHTFFLPLMLSLL